MYAHDHVRVSAALVGRTLRPVLTVGAVGTVRPARGAPAIGTKPTMGTKRAKAMGIAIRLSSAVPKFGDEVWGVKRTVLLHISLRTLCAP